MQSIFILLSENKKIYQCHILLDTPTYKNVHWRLWHKQEPSPSLTRSELHFNKTREQKPDSSLNRQNIFYTLLKENSRWFSASNSNFLSALACKNNIVTMPFKLQNLKSPLAPSASSQVIKWNTFLAISGKVPDVIYVVEWDTRKTLCLSCSNIPTTPVHKLLLKLLSRQATRKFHQHKRAHSWERK